VSQKNQITPQGLIPPVTMKMPNPKSKLEIPIASNFEMSIEKLAMMGFSRENCIKALSAFANEDIAIDWLLNQQENSNDH
jgi:uncharacterized UBP type Zn finger protein